MPAFVHRAHVAFAGAAPAWRSGAGRKLWAHELAHAAQFIGTGEVGSADEINRFGDSAEGEARAAAEALIRGERYVPRRAPENEFQPFLGDAADWVADTASDAVDWAGEQVDDAIEWTADQLRELIPDEVLEFVEDVSSVVQEWIEDGFAAWLEDVLAQVSFVDSIQPFFEAIGKYAGDFNSFGTTISETAGEALSPIFEPIVSALSEWINPALEAQISTLQSEQEAQDELEKELFEQDAQNIQGVVDSIRDGVEDIWDTITEFLSSIPGAEEAWEWLKEAFNFVVDTIEEIVEWVMEQVSELWEWVSEAIEPIKPALEMIAKILFILSPLGPIYILMEYGPQLWEYITEWFGDFDLGSILTERLDTFTDEVLPFFRNAVRSAAGAVAAGIEMVIPVIDTMLAGAEELTGFEIEWLAVLRVWLRWVASEARKFAKLTDEQIKAMMDAAVAAFTALAEFLGKLVDFFVRLVMVVLNPFMLPFAITGVLWLLLPDAFKPPIIDFILNLIIIASMEFPTDLFGLGPLGPVIKAAIVAFFMSLKEGGNLEEVPEPRRSDAATERKINATNKIASIAAGGGVQFVAGYFVGLLEGIWTGLSDPFVLIWDLLSFVFTAVGKLLEFVHHMGEQMFEGGGESRGGATGAASGAADLEPDVRADMSAEEQAALDEVMTETADEVQPEGSMPSQETLDELGASEEAGARIGEEFEASRDEASSTEGIDVERIMNWLWSVRTRMREGAASLGAQIAEAFYDFIEQSDFQLGRSLGNVAGQILFEIILGILTAGGWTALSVAKPFIKVGAKIAKMLKRTIRPLIRLIKRLRGPVSRGMTAIGDILRQIPGMRGIIDRIEDAMRRMMRYVDEFEAPPRRSGGTPDATPDRPPRDRTTSDSDRPPRDSGGDPDRNRTNDPDRDPNRHPDDDRPPRDDRPRDRESDMERLRSARRRIRPVIDRLLDTGPSHAVLTSTLRTLGRLNRVRLRIHESPSGRFEIVGQINPPLEFIEGFNAEGRQLVDISMVLARQLLGRVDVKRMAKRKFAALRTNPTEELYPQSGPEHLAILRRQMELGPRESGIWQPGMARRHRRAGGSRTGRNSGHEVRISDVDSGNGNFSNSFLYRHNPGLVRGNELGTYAQILETAQQFGMTDEVFARGMRQFIQAGRLSGSPGRSPERARFIAAAAQLMMNRESHRNPSNAVVLPMVLDLLESSDHPVSMQELFASMPDLQHGTHQYGGGGTYPMSMSGAPRGSRNLMADLWGQDTEHWPLPGSEHYENPGNPNGANAFTRERDELTSRQQMMILRWVQARVRRRDLYFDDAADARRKLTHRIRIWLYRDWYPTSPR